MSMGYRKMIFFEDMEKFSMSSFFLCGNNRPLKQIGYIVNLLKGDF